MTLASLFVCRCKTDINFNSEHSAVKVLMEVCNENKGDRENGEKKCVG
jgi:hypothetical protein